MIPKHAKRVFKGKVFEIHQWQQKMYDSTTKTFEIAKRQDAASIIAVYKNKIVVLKQKQPTKQWYYAMPGGYLDPGENPKQAAVRELLEETGLKPKKVKLWKSYKGSARVASNYHIFIAQDCEKVGEQKLDGGEIIEIQLKTFDQFLKFCENEELHNRDIVIETLRASLSPKKKTALKKLFFG